MKKLNNYQEVQYQVITALLNSLIGQVNDHTLDLIKYYLEKLVEALQDE